MGRGEVGDVNFRSVARWSALGGLVTALALAAPAASHRRYLLPACPEGAASTTPPTGPAGRDAPGACRATGPILESAVRLDLMRGATTPSGYHHLGAGTAGEWRGVSGRISIVDGGVRPNTYDFVAGRFMVKRDMGGGSIAWLEAGWAETGWAGAGRQHIYTFNTNTKTWQFYDQYQLRPGDRAWLDLHTDSDNVWQAWLWWNDRWNLLTAQRLPIGASAYVEQYVEVHVDSSRAARLPVPPVTVDNVQLRAPGDGSPRYWREDVDTQIGGTAQQRSAGFCLDWLTQYDTWRAGDCPGGAGGSLGDGLATDLVAEPAPATSGSADVVGEPEPAASADADVVGEPEPATSPSPNVVGNLLGPVLGG
ncbi:hypothetical protein Adi01nite_50170 [Amorphoplanes digitatis]|nr:hypothetical protein Adi01nite_50170 [Actinoplanes digitatis]